METIMMIGRRALDFVLSLQFWDVLDILVIAFLVYQLLVLIHKTNSSASQGRAGGAAGAVDLGGPAEGPQLPP